MFLFCFGKYRSSSQYRKTSGPRSYHCSCKNHEPSSFFSEEFIENIPGIIPFKGQLYTQTPDSREIL